MGIRIRTFISLSRFPSAAFSDRGIGKPAKIASQMFILGEWVVQEQWPHTLNLVNIPEGVTILYPGQCIHVGIVADGDNRDTFLQQTKLSFQIRYAGQSLDHDLSALGRVKQIKPEGGDFVTQALGSAGVANPLLTLASLGISADTWCVPADAQDGSVTLQGVVETPKGHQKLKESKVQIETIETGSKRTFKNAQELGGFLSRYYRHPNPARLFPALQFFCADEKARANAGTTESTAAFLSAALKTAPAAARDFQSRVSSQTGFTRALGLMVLQNAGYDIEPVLKAMSDEDREIIRKAPSSPIPTTSAPPAATSPLGSTRCGASLAPPGTTNQCGRSQVPWHGVRISRTSTKCGSPGNALRS